MKLERLDIRAEDKYVNGYGSAPIKVYVGTVKFQQATGNIEILLSPEQISGIVHLIGDTLIDATKKVAEAMNHSLMEITQPVKEISNV